MKTIEIEYEQIKEYMLRSVRRMFDVGDLVGANIYSDI